ncbi:MAG: hypothetical protein JSV88_27070 [Candidatus Aminicenantes bacterium]|nr:MAG: hypothetical protein JSV88_27070 [Candidatus Aminicenantes bacterium]
MIKKKILKKGALVTLFFFICFTVTTQFTFATDEDILLKARMLVKKGDFDGAIKELYEVIEKLKVISSQKRNLAEAYYLLARVYKIVQMESECKYHLKMALTIYPNFTIEVSDPQLIEMMKQVKAELEKEEQEKAKLEKERQEKEKVIEKPVEKKKKKKKKFPVLLVVAGVAVVAVVVALLSKKKKETKTYVLTVTRGEGVDGTPNTGTMTYNEGTTVNYNYSLQSGYKDLEVRVDGNVVSSSGTITMDRDHTLSATASQLDRYTLSVTRGEGVVGSPDSGNTTYDEGTQVNYSYSLQSGYIDLVVTLDGAAVPASGIINMNSNHTLIATASLAGDEPPTVSITSPANGDIVSGTTTIYADASDDKGISKVEFYIDGSLEKTDTSSPYRHNWNTRGYPNGPHTIKVIAYDTANQSKEAEISVTVNNEVYDINGTWRFNVYTGEGTNRYTLVFTGSQTEGNVYVAGESQDRGDYKVDENEVEFTLYDDDFDNVGSDWKYTFEGKFDDENSMSGNYIWQNYIDGNLDEQETGSWDARRL